VAVRGPFAGGVPTDGGNLVARALLLAGRRARVTIDKRIPHGGGLGGGSADAAAVLRWGGFHDLVAASRLGADIPFCMVGGRARVRGIGEVVEPLPFEALDVTLIVPPVGVSTPAVYRTWDEMGGPTGAHGNDLEPAAVGVVPALAAWRERIIGATGQVPRLAGSGATWFLEGHHRAARELEPEAAVVLTRTRPAP
jgi:4-diphosphocytidyl-2-C-methyl-D-erythritol kinase